MSERSTSATSPWAPPDPATAAGAPPPPARPRGGAAARVRDVAILVGLLGVAAGLFFAGVVNPFDDDDRGPSHPDRWDPRVADLAATVEEIRGLTFEHPVAVEFLADAEFVEQLQSGYEPTHADRETAEQQEAALRAVGLVEGDVDLLAQSDQAAAEGTLGYYEPDTDRLYVRGDDLTPAVRATVVHELTHALQDQHFDLRRALTATSDGAATAGRAFIEADASWVEDQWALDLSPAEMADYLGELTEFATDMEMDDVPDVLVEAMSFPYVFGPVLHATVLADGGQAAVDAAFDALPRSEEHVLDPASFLDDDAPVEVEAPEHDELGELLEESDLGAFGLFQILGSRLDYAPTRAAVEGWGGDVLRTYAADDGRVCVAYSVTGDDAADTDELETALTQWAEGIETASASRDGDVVTMTSCDPSDALPPSAHRSETGAATQVLMVRASLINEAATFAGLDIDTATCVADAVVDELGVDRVAQIAEDVDSASEPDPELLDAFSGAVGGCT